MASDSIASSDLQLLARIQPLGSKLTELSLHLRAAAREQAADLRRRVHLAVVLPHDCAESLGHMRLGPGQGGEICIHVTPRIA